MKRAAGILLAAVLACAPLVAQADPQTDFFRAVKVDDERALQRLVEGGIDPNLAEPSRGENGLLIAIREDSMRVFDILLRHPRTQVDQPAMNGNTALMMAALKGNRQAARALLQRGAAVNRPGWTPLHYAAASGDVHIATLLIEHKAELDSRAPTGATPLIMAAQEGKEEIVRLLLARGANPFLLDNYRRTALRVAELMDRREISQLLAAHMAAAAPPKPVSMQR